MERGEVVEGTETGIEERGKEELRQKMSECVKCGECEAEICQDCYEVRVKRTPLEEAAPDLLEACKYAQRVLLQSRDYTANEEYTVRTVQDLTAAIAKAQGNQ